jgi:hypothetical protein
VQTPHEYPLTPSEIILLGDEAPGHWKNLIRRMLIAAFIANDRVGAIRFQIHDRKSFLGMRSTEDLLVVPSERSIEWPSPSLEAEIISIAKRLSSQRKNIVSTIVYEWMSGDSNEPWDSAVATVREQLMTRRLLEKIEVKHFWIFKTYRIFTPRSTLDIVSQAPVSLISRMISDFERTQRVLSPRLLKEASKGVERRKSSDNYYPY